ncbi:MAG TPA: 2-dehydropantoate 2-reductase [Candidatus Krumholzibacteria bacterium]|nr:2-dehydropantoate 2-reductase [Candidatus Krumholzibacteria bacterium]
MQFVVYGAGAVGSVLGGMLSLHRHDVLLVGRPALVDAVREGGLRLKSATGEYVSHPRVAAALSAGDVGADTHVLFTVKSYDVPSAVAALAKVAPSTSPVVCFQNGIDSEDVVAKHFARVYGAVVRMTCSMVQPGHASFRALGRLVLGAHPKGTDAVVAELVAAFRAAGFDAAASKSIVDDKWLKLAVNAQSVVHALVDARDQDENEFFDLKVAILEETRRVYKAAKVKARSGDGKDPSIDEMIAEIKRPRARRNEHGVKVHNSVWQDFYLKRPRIEADAIHGPVIALGKEHGVATPYHDASLALARRCHVSKSAPESIRLSEVLSEIAKRRS